ncbi:MAG: DUF2617 family protein [Planctomycetaceae bacterium]
MVNRDPSVPSQPPFDRLQPTKLRVNGARMHVSYTRPDAGQLSFRLYDRPLHPELFDRFAGATLRSADCVARIWVCDGGHTVQVTVGSQTLTEILGPSDQELPTLGRCLGYHLRGHRDISQTQRGGLSFQASTQVEQVAADVFVELHAELRRVMSSASVAHEFPGGHRFAPSPLSLIRGDFRPGSLLLHAFHTFPDDCTILRTQSLFEW